MLDWVNLAGFVAIMTALLGIILPMLRATQKQIDKLDEKIFAVDRKLDTRFDFLTGEVINIHKQVAVAYQKRTEPEVILPRGGWR